MAVPPNKTELVDVYPDPSTGVFKAGLGKFYDYVKALLGSTGNALEARAALGAQLEPGIVGYTAASAPPPGWLKRNGAAVSRTTYAALFAAIGTTYGAGDGTTTFNLPEARGEFDRGWDDGRGVDAGRLRGSFQGPAIESHSHSISPIVALPGTGGGTGYTFNQVGTAAPLAGGVTGSAGTTETRPRNVAYLPIIKF